MSNRWGKFWYNQDRAVASLLFDTAQETISSEVGRIVLGAGKVDGWTPRYKFQIVLARLLAKWLDSTPKIWGVDHTHKAILHADKLDAVDDGREQ